MNLVMLTFVGAFVLVASCGLLIFYRESATQKRLGSVVSGRQASPSTMDRLRQLRSASAVESIVLPFQKFLPRSPEEVSVVQKRLIRAGYRRNGAVELFYGAKALTPILLILLVSVTQLHEYGGFFAYALAGALGFLLPDFWLGQRISVRKAKIRMGLPEVLDLLVVCVEAGLGLDQAILRVAEELHLSQPEVSDELGVIVLEQRGGLPRTEAWKHMAERTDVDSIRALVATMVQADQFGTSISKTLRVYSDTFRTQRRQQVEETAAKTTVKLVFPLVFFIFPSLFVVALGPSMILMLEAFKNLF